MPGGPPVSEEEWRAKIRTWFPTLYDTRLVRPTWAEIAQHHEAIKNLVGVVPASVIHQRLTDEEGLCTSVASLRRYLRAHFADEVRRGDVVLWRPPVDPGEEVLCGIPHRTSYGAPGNMRRGGRWPCSGRSSIGGAPHIHSPSRNVISSSSG